MFYFLSFIAVCVIVAFLCWSILQARRKNQKNQKTKNVQSVKCPLCQTSLFVGENIYSKIYRPMNVPDQYCTISGCPHCFPVCESGVKRVCPVCHKEVSLNQNLTARLFNKAFGKKHVHILGCSNCHAPRSK